MTAKTFVDTNVLVYLFDHDEPSKRDRAVQLTSQADAARLVLSAQVLGELYVTITRKLARPVDPVVASEVVEDLGALEVVPTDSALVRSAMHTSRSARVSYWDALVISAARRAGCERLLTEDLNDGQRFGSVLVQNPFRE
jgi:predicted nucleic acid-binding protein